MSPAAMRALPNQRVSPHASRLLSGGAFEHRLHSVLERDTATRACLLQADIDRFDALADRFGTCAGDAVIQAVAQLLLEHLPGALVARRGHHSFLVLLEGLRLPTARRIAARACARVAGANVRWRAEPLHATISLGGVEMQPRMLGAGDALCAADIACREARDAGGNAVRIHRWDDTLVLRETREVNELPGLQRALDAERFVLHVQPIRNLSANAPACGEVLVRMLEENGALRLPACFVPAAERFGLMASIDRLVVRQTLAWLRSQPDAAARIDYLSINLSGQTLSSAQARDEIEGMIRTQAGDATRLCFEVTETSLIKDLQEARGFLDRLSRLGCRIALDDFGTGFSSLGYLQTLPVHFVKIDGAFVRACDTDERTRTLLAAINDLCHAMGKQTIAEYAERASVVAVVRELRVDHAQGFAIAEPFPLAELGERMQAA